ncbi:TonB-dependent receptor domain-containing protein [Mongoliitalea daihaiensis]|uniref:TonB-dependent receptor domain-containing protein n=1 Tax=Mongoliitalea daihaiensis TaxID=2782006 RepID=UPI001F3BA5E8|nr:TonB-dependent receptor [Mongoliitalea daihaiensis]UJP63610.1 TonB-dependent receptor [Mongoliitalea daihaiensis]
MFSIPIRWIMALLLSFSFIYTTFAQTIQLLDRQTLVPIIGLTYHYADQSGVSDELGNITLRFQKGESIHFSHVLYGKWSLKAPELQTALQQGRVLRTEQAYHLQQVTVISLKQTDEKDQRIMISDQERLHHDAGAILNQNPVVNGIRKSGAFAFDPVMRGFKYEQLNIVIDGLQSAIAACPNRMDPPTSQIALNRIKQVEILKGPHALRYGIGLGGTINFVQEDPNFSSPNGVYGRYSSMYEHNGNIWRHEGRVGLSGENHDIGIMGSWSAGTDYVDGEGNVVPANFRRGTVGMYGDFKVGRRDLVQVTVNRNFARDVDFPSLAMDLRSDDTWMGSLRHTRTFQQRNLLSWTSSIYLTKVDHLMDNLLRDLNPRMSNARVPAFTQNYGGRTEGLWKLGNGRIYAGADYRSESAQGIREREFLMGPMAGRVVLDNAWQDSQIQKLGTFVNYNLPLGAYMFSVSGRLDVNHAVGKDILPEFEQANRASQVTQLNPGISLGLKKDLTDELNMSVWLARVQRSGSLTERFINYFPVGMDPFELVGNAALKPETNNQLDFVVGYKKEKIQVEFNAFAAYLTDYITAERTELTPRIASAPGVRQFINIDRALKTGVELNLSQYLGWGLQQQFAFAYTYGQNLSLSEALPEIAPLDIRYALIGNHLDSKLHTALRLRHVTAQNRVSALFGEMTTPGFTLVDVDASYAITSQLALKVGAQNLLNLAYYEHLNRPIGSDRRPLFAPGRNFFVMVSMKFP